MIYIIYGANGIGKKTVKDHISAKYGIQVIDKHINEVGQIEYIDGVPRLLRDKSLVAVLQESNKNKVMSNTAFAKHFDSTAFVYQRKKHVNSEISTVSYAILKDDLRKASQDKERDYLLVLSRHNVVQHVKQLINNDSLVKIIFIAGDMKFESDEDKRRWEAKEIIDTNKRFNEAVSEFAGVILNPTNYDAEDRCKKIEQQWEHITKMLATEVRKTAFIVRPFNPLVKANTAVHSHLESILRKHGLEPKVVQPVLNKLIVASIEEEIRKAGLVVVDLREHKPNCYYELAFARSLGKTILTIVDVEGKDNIAFDTSGYPYFPYKIIDVDGKINIEFCEPIHGQLNFDEEVANYCRVNRIGI